MTGRAVADGSPMSNVATTFKPVSRAVLRRVEAGNTATCAHCGDPVKFTAKTQRQQVIANVYVDFRWDRVEHYHAECYEEAGQPYGPAAG
jgi:hypothetical protein